MQIPDLSKMMSFKILSIEDPKEFEVEMTKLLRSGWNSVSTSTNVAYCQQDKKFKTHFLGMYAKQGLSQ